jgi:hypothetical protein
MTRAELILSPTGWLLISDVIKVACPQSTHVVAISGNSGISRSSDIFHIAVSLTSTPNFSDISSSNEILPMPPTLRTVEPPFTHSRSHNEQSPALDKSLCIVQCRYQLNSMRCSWQPQTPLTRSEKSFMMNTSLRNCVLNVLSLQKVGQIDVHVIVKRLIVVRTQELMEVDIKDRIAWQHPPAPQIRFIRSPDNEIRRATLGNSTPPSHFFYNPPT